MIDPENEEYSNDPNDALRKEDDTENIHELNGADIIIEHDKDLLQQADRASRAAYELNLDDLKEEGED